ncbi:MAG: hypothetical protein II730_00205 [Bacteroidales bacterium]|nr:hypothetical protein [Bacteroidales bacterium]
MDIDLLSKMVKDLILDNDEVSLPGVGTFVAELVPSTFSDKGYTINPPYRRLYFRQRKETSDTALVDLYAKSNNLDEERAQQIIDDFLTEMKDVLRQKKTIIFPGLGKLRATKENNIFFVADEDLDIYPSGFGLNPISLKTHVETTEEVAAAVASLKDLVAPSAQQPVPVPEPQIPVQDVPDTPETPKEAYERPEMNMFSQVAGNHTPQPVPEVMEEPQETVAEEEPEVILSETEPEAVSSEEEPAALSEEAAEAIIQETVVEEETAVPEEESPSIPEEENPAKEVPVESEEEIAGIGTEIFPDNEETEEEPVEEVEPAPVEDTQVSEDEAPEETEDKAEDDTVITEESPAEEEKEEETLPQESDEPVVEEKQEEPIEIGTPIEEELPEESTEEEAAPEPEIEVKPVEEVKPVPVPKDAEQKGPAMDSKAMGEKVAALIKEKNPVISTPSVLNEPEKKEGIPVWAKVLLWTLGILVALVILYMIIGRIAPNFIDSILYSREDFEFLHEGKL